MLGVLGRSVAAVVWFLILFSGFMGTIGPQCSLSSPWIPGVLSAVITLTIILIGSTWADAWQKSSILATFGIVATVTFCVALPLYVANYQVFSVETVSAEQTGARSMREVKGSVYTDEANSLRFVQEDISDDELLDALGSVDRVWTGESIQPYWYRVLIWYVIAAVALGCAVFFLGALFDSLWDKSAPPR